MGEFFFYNPYTKLIQQIFVKFLPPPKKQKQSKSKQKSLKSNPKAFYDPNTKTINVFPIEIKEKMEISNDPQETYDQRELGIYKEALNHEFVHAIDIKP